MSPRRFSRLGAPAAAALALLVTLALIKAVYVTPHAVFIDHDVKSAQVNLGNPGDAAEEVTVALMFGYPETDSLGTPVIRYIEEPGPEYPSAAGWIRAFPRRVRIEPGDRQVVRLLATPPADLPDGEYWTRLIVSSGGAAIPLATGDTAVRAGVTLEIRIVTSVIYRKGELGTGVSVKSLAASVANDSLIVWMEADREGDAAYLGTAQFDLVDAAGGSVEEWSVPPTRSTGDSRSRSSHWRRGRTDWSSRRSGNSGDVRPVGPHQLQSDHRERFPASRHRWHRIPSRRRHGW